MVQVWETDSSYEGKREERALSTQNRVCCGLFLIFLA